MGTNDLKPLTLHALESRPNPAMIAITLEFLSVAYKVQLWEFSDDPQNGIKGKAFLSINDNGTLPVLQDPNTGVVSLESGAILNHIQRNYDEKRAIGPRGKAAQDIVDFETWTFILLTGLGPMTVQATWYSHDNETQNDDALGRFRGQVYRHYDRLERQLQKTDGGSVLVGGLSAVDLQFYPWVLQYELAGTSLEKYPAIQKWLKTVAEIPAVKAAYKSLEDAASKRAHSVM